MPGHEPPSRNEPREGENEPRIEPEVIEEPKAYPVAGEVIQREVRPTYPTPQELREYEEVHPGFTNRILTLTERETEHRIQQDNATIDLAKRGQIFAFIVVMTLVIGGVVAILTDHSIVGLGGLVVAAVTLVGAFVAPNLFSRGSDESVPGTEIKKRTTPTAGGSKDRRS